MPIWAKINVFDDYWIDFKKNVLRRWYRPEKRSEYVDLNLNGGGCYQTAMWSPEQNCYLLWYEYVRDADSDECRYLSVARSDDGIHWEPWNRNQCDTTQKKVYPNTIYLGNPGIHGGSVYRDEREENPEWRYKLCSCGYTGLYQKRGIQNSAVILSTSPDGLHWTPHEEMEVHPNTSDTTNYFYYNPVTEEYNALIRAGFVDRRVCLTTSKDLVHWSRPKVILHPGAEFNNDAYATQFYGLVSRWMDGYFVGFLWRYYTSCGDFDYSRMKGFQDTELVYSYDGEHWMRTTGRPFQERPLPPEFGFSSLNFNSIYPDKDNEKLYLIASGSRMMHSGVGQYPGFLEEKKAAHSAAITYELRKDGFCGLEANTTDGLLVTKAMELCGEDLYLNVNAAFGRVRMAVYDHQGQPYEGFDFEDCQPVQEDGCKVRPTFKGHDIRELRGKRIRIALRLECATLYCIEGPLRPWIRFPQTSLCDPRHALEYAATPRPDHLSPCGAKSGYGRPKE